MSQHLTTTGTQLPTPRTITEIVAQHVAREGYTPTQLSTGDSQLLRNVTAHFRYGAMLPRPRFETAADVATYLAQFAEVLSTELDKVTEKVERLERLEQDMRTLRRVLGTEES